MQPFPNGNNTKKKSIFERFALLQSRARSKKCISPPNASGQRQHKKQRRCLLPLLLLLPRRPLSKQKSLPKQSTYIPDGVVYLFRTRKIVFVSPLFILGVSKYFFETLNRIMVKVFDYVVFERKRSRTKDF